MFFRPTVLAAVAGLAFSVVLASGVHQVGAGHGSFSAVQRATAATSASAVSIATVASTTFEGSTEAEESASADVMASLPDVCGAFFDELRSGERRLTVLDRHRLQIDAPFQRTSIPR